MTDVKKPLTTRTQIALDYLKAIETDDVETLKRLLADSHQRILCPFEREKPPGKEQILAGKGWRTNYREIQGTPLDVMETLDGRVVIHIRWKGLRNDGRWIQREEIRVLSFTDGLMLLDDPQIEQVKMFVDWVGLSQWALPASRSSTLSIGSLYNQLMGLGKAHSKPQTELSEQGDGGHCSVM